jgi:2-polyprenyl-6-methoxyphenol hydroxylase-like FAD-dependent oxidoreductase
VSAAGPHAIHSTQTVTCCIAGGGPAGAVLALLLARKGIRVALLEAHHDFDRDFRGDTLHPSVMELMDELGLAEKILQLRHSKIRTANAMTPDGLVTVADLRHIDSKFPYITMVPQVHFLELVTEEAKRYPNFTLLMGAGVQELIEEYGVIRGVRYKTEAGWHEVRALLTVGADGRGSRIRRLAGLDDAVKTSPPMDVLWFRLPRRVEDGEGLLARFGSGHILVMLDRNEQWQLAYVIVKGAYQQIHEQGLDALKRSIAATAPELAGRVDRITEWKQISVISVESTRCVRWSRPGLLLIGDAAHIMSPVGGVGINYAIQDAVVAANVLTRPLREGKVDVRLLHQVQRQREWPTRIIQWVQTQVQKRVIAAALRSDQPLTVPKWLQALLKFPAIRNIQANLLAFGVVKVHVQQDE